MQSEQACLHRPDHAHAGRGRTANQVAQAGGRGSKDTVLGVDIVRSKRRREEEANRGRQYRCLSGTRPA
jgi:hypothetical protein